MGIVPGLRIARTEDGMALSGEVDVSTWPLLSGALHSLVDGGGERHQLVLDISELSFIDGHGVGLIAEAARKLEPSRRIVLRGASPTMLFIAGVLHLDREPGLVIKGQDIDGKK
jgi:anti-anti-sigma factor